MVEHRSKINEGSGFDSKAWSSRGFFTIYPVWFTSYSLVTFTVNYCVVYSYYILMQCSCLILESWHDGYSHFLDYLILEFHVLNQSCSAVMYSLWTFLEATDGMSILNFFLLIFNFALIMCFCDVQ